MNRARRRSGSCGLVLAAAATVVGVLAAGCDEPARAVRPVVKTESAPAAPAAPWKPAWWHDAPQREGVLVSVCTKADATDLLAARRRALDAVGEAFWVAAGRAASQPQIQADSVRLDSGMFRAFVRLTAAGN